MPRPPAARTPREVLDRFHQAMRDKSADDLADLYAEDGVHEFPFAFPGFPERYEGRERVREGYRATWGSSPVRVREVRSVAVHEDPGTGTLVAEHVVVAETPDADGTFTIPGLLVLHVKDGRLTRVRDYMDGLSVARARGLLHEPPTKPN
ncbi:nuclear transport factor 2 family protein [Actinomadura kijaniata]|uniref:nuclear transport factor 2 family protein n=1 Tax=Actinomadura kijaniata TaxID=46161 RepID=UPI003F1A9820